MKRAPFKLSGRSAEVWIYDTIGETWEGGISAKAFADDLRDLGSLDEIVVRINSNGGDVFEAAAIYNALLRHPARVIVEVDGAAISAASAVAMAGDTIRMAANAMMMIHDPWTIALGSADEFRKVADSLDLVKSTIVDTYMRHAKVDRAQVESWMAAETWFKADTAIEAGLAHEKTGEQAVANAIDPRRFKNFPRDWQGQVSHQSPPPAAWRLSAAKRALALASR